MISFKEPIQSYEYRVIHPMLRQLMNDIIDYAEKTWQRNIVVTSVARIGDPISNHCARPVRAVDIRMHDWPADDIDDMRDYINSRWKYDPDRPVLECLHVHGDGDNLHGHVQVHPPATFRLAE